VAPLFGLNIHPLRMDQVIDRCRHAVNTRSPLLLGVVNASKVVNVRKDVELHDALHKCDLLVADGQSVVWASRLLRRPVPERVAGIDIFERLLHVAHEESLSIYLLGATPEVLSDLETHVGSRFPGARIAGSRHGYFEDHEAEDIAADIRDCLPDMLFLGMPSPKKERFLATYRETVSAPVMHGVGGSFDVLAGKTKRAPLSWQKYGMEWAFRLVQEPRRMWRRYLYTNTAFAVLTVKEMAGFRYRHPTRPNDPPLAVPKTPKSSASTSPSRPEFHHG
jgi:N-acetylglucosaminyldiphosphoundecaprenol N-acetyl-beta-D-mannosaminyltransferase